MKKYRILCLSFLLIFSISCAHKILKKPDVNMVKKLAIISVFSNSVVYKTGDDGGSLAALTSLVSKEDEGSEKKKEKAFGGKRLVNYALRHYTKKLSTVDGWKVVSSDKVVNSKAYNDFKKAVKEQQGALGGLATVVDKLAYAVPTKMIAYPIQGEQFDAKMLKKLCKDLKVDAVAVIELDMAYSAYWAVGSTGTAAASVSTAIKAVNSEGKLVIGTLDVTKGEGKRSISEGQTPMISGNILFNAKTEKMYKEAIDAEAKMIIDQMKEEYAAE